MLLKFIKFILITLGVLFLIIILVAAYFWFADPFEIRSFTSSEISIQSALNTVSGNTIEIDNIDKNPLLDEVQEAQLETLGINPEDLPSEITPEMETCLLNALGNERATQILEGNQPTGADFFKSKHCLQ